MRAAFWRVEVEGARLGLKVRAGGIAVIALALAFRASGATLWWYYAVLLLLLLAGACFFLTITSRRLAGSPLGVALRGFLVAMDMVVVTAVLIAPAPTVADVWPAPMQLRIASEMFLVVFMALSAMTLSPALALWSGLCAAAAWMGGVLYALRSDGAFTRTPAQFAEMELGEIFATLTDPAYVSVIGAAQDAVLIAIVGAIIAAAAWRGRLLAMRQVASAQERAALLRYFSPDVAEQLTRRRGDLDALAVRRAGVIFADIFGFSTMAESMSPRETIAFLREFHQLATGAVFAHDGTLNKFIGDEVMASFGAITPMPDAPAAALECAVALAERAADWSAARQARGLAPVRVGVGVHVGPVVVGDIGDTRCLELAVLGDVVNTANRLQHATRSHDVCIVASDAVLQAAVAQRPELAALASRFEALPATQLKGKHNAVPTAGMRWSAVGLSGRRAAME